MERIKDKVLKFENVPKETLLKDPFTTLEYLKSKYGEPIHQDCINGLMIFIFKMTKSDFNRLFENYYSNCDGRFIYNNNYFEITEEERKLLLNLNNHENAGVILYLNYGLHEKNRMLESLSNTYAENILTALNYIHGKLKWGGVHYKDIAEISKEKFRESLNKKLREKKTKR